MNPLSLSLRTSVVGAFCVLVGTICLVGALAISISIRSAQQATSFQEQSVAPVVALGVLSDNLDQERDLLSKNIPQMQPARQRAAEDELSTLDASIATTATRILLPRFLVQWRVTWNRYVTLRGTFVQQLLRRHKAPASDMRDRLSDRLDRVLDVLQSQAGVHLYRGQRLYVRAVDGDWNAIRLTAVSVALSLLLALGFAVLIVRRLTRGLSNLTAAAAAISDGRLDVRAEAVGRDELAMVARAFNHMMNTLLQLQQTALTDPLTGLGNHRAFHEELRRELAKAARHGHPLCLALIDLDDFKLINDQHGHAQGDRVLVELAACLRRMRTEDRSFRIGGDEFALLLPYASGAEAMVALERLRITVNSTVPGATVSVGVAEFGIDVDDAETLREQADVALYESKRQGRNAAVLFDSIKAHAAIVSPAKVQAVRRLLTDPQVTIAFQPIWSLERTEILGYEALMRPLSDTGLTSPQEAFDIAEKLGRAPELDQLCLDAILDRAHELPADTLLFINLSPQSLDRGALESAALLQRVQEARLTPSRIVFEITERSMTRVEVVVREAKRLRALGFQLALDDVGAGNAGLDMLRQVSVDFVKIDRKVIAQALIDEAAAAVLSGIVAFARRARTFVIAEGIETQAMLDIVNQAGLPDPETEGGVQGVQGYLFGKPSEIIPSPEPPVGTVLSYDELRARHRTAG